ncbi:hypothetical protein AEMCBJ_34330 (plasmid) [Cupriavidus necator]
MACGTGKTLTTLWVTEDLGVTSTLVLVPSIALLDQFATEWSQHASSKYSTLCVCSDSSVGRNNDEDALLTTNDLLRHGYEVSSDPSRIADFLLTPGIKVVFSTYQSSHLIMEAQRRESVPAFGLAIADEAHRCAGDPASVFGTVLDGRKIRADRRLFATATPRVYTQRERRSNSERSILDMSNHAAFGPRFHSLEFAKAIELGLLCDYQVVVMLVTDAEVQALIDGKSKKTDRSSTDTLADAAQIGLLKAIRELGLKRVITFHRYVSSAKEFARSLRRTLQSGLS